MLIKLAWRNIWRNKRRSAITIVSILIAVFLAVLMRSMQLGMYANMIENVVGSYSGYVQIHKQGFWEEQKIDNGLAVSPELIQKIEAVKGVTNIIQRIQTFALASKDEISQGIMVSGIDQEKENLLVDWNTRLVEGNLLSGKSNEVAIAKGVAKIFEAGVGDTMVFIGQGYHGVNAAGKYVITGIVDLKNPKLNNMNVFLNIKTAQDFVGAENLSTHLIIDKAELTDAEVLATALRNELDAEQYEVMTWPEMLPELEQMIQADSAGGLIMIFILYMIITFGIFGTVLMMTQERTYEYGVLLSIGMKRLKLIWTVLFETVMLSLLGVAAGILCALPLTYYFYANPLVLSGEEAETIEEMGFDPVIPASIDPSILGTHGLIIFVIALVIVLYPTWIIRRMDPVKAMKR